MGKQLRFEDLKVWQDARDVCKWVSSLQAKLNEKHLFRLKDQIEGSSGSVMDNITEGYERTGKKELINFLIIAKGSAGEMRSQVYRLFDNEVIDENEMDIRIDMCLSISRQINGFIKYLKGSEHSGWRFKEPPTDYGEDLD